MELSPRLYHWIVRPKWFVKLSTSNITRNFKFDNCSVLDFGCGIGIISSLFAKEYYLGIDIDGERIKYAERIFPNYNFYVFEEQKLPVTDNTIEYILINSVLHHIDSEAVSPYIKEFFRVLKPNGKIIISEPYLKKGSLRNYLMRFLDKGKYIRYENEYLDFFNENNYETKVIKKYSQLLCYNKLLFTVSHRA